tara:strand:+ start:2828 stop:3082 length:255 start_codon:yes stop_codon:yes gene_type:complete
MSKENHKTRLLQYLKDYGTITSLEAIRDLGNTRLAAYIFKLKKDGHHIDTLQSEVKTRWVKEDGTPKTTHVALYVYTPPVVKLT